MTIQTELDHFLQRSGAASIVAFGDLSSGLILKWASKAPCPRESLDQMGAKAATILSAFFPYSDRSDGRAGSGHTAIHFTESTMQLYLRQDGNTEDLLCISVAPGSPTDALLPEATALAQRLAGAT